MPKVTGKLKTKHESNGSLPNKSKSKTAKPPGDTVVSGSTLSLADDYPLSSIPPKEPLWGGPEVDGITFSLFSKFLCCRERFRLLVVEGLKEKQGFNLRLEYGNMIHVCEEATAAKKPWEPALLAYAQQIAKKYGNSESATIDKWYKVCCAQYPVYLSHWKKEPDVVKRQPLFQEKPFDIRYTLPSGRVVRLRGKFDAIDLIAKKLYVQENKARGEINADQMLSELPLDLQTMGFYMTAAEIEFGKSYSIGGVRYNIIRRPLSGGKYSIKQLEGRGKDKKGAETEEQFFARLQKDCIAADPTHFFYRWKIEVVPDQDIRGFQVRCLNPLLEQLWDWWTWIKCDPFNPWRQRTIGELLNACPVLDNIQRKFVTSSDTSYLQPNCIHWLHPSGVYNPTMEGRASAYDEYILTKSDRGLLRTDNLFPELE
jgi:hypothetical protein